MRYKYAIPLLTQYIVTRWVVVYFCNIFANNLTYMPARYFAAVDSDQEPVSSNAYLKCSQCLRTAVPSYRSNQIWINAHKQTYFNLMTCNAGSTQPSRTNCRLRNTLSTLIWPHGSCFCFCNLCLKSEFFTCLTQCFLVWLPACTYKVPKNYNWFLTR